MSKSITLYCDGLCEPFNPGGYACWGWNATDTNSKEIASGHGCIGRGPLMTNNLAEYRAAIEALKWAADGGLQGIVLKTDSQLVANQVNGEWACHKPHLIPMLEKVRLLLAQVGGWIVWVPREQNERADALSRQAYREAREVGR